MQQQCTRCPRTPARVLRCCTPVLQVDLLIMAGVFVQVITPTTLTLRPPAHVQFSLRQGIVQANFPQRRAGRTREVRCVRGTQISQILILLCAAPVAAVALSAAKRRGTRRSTQSLSADSEQQRGGRVLDTCALLCTVRLTQCD